jgi:hypothetical protein
MGFMRFLSLQGWLTVLLDASARPALQPAGRRLRAPAR